jgi:phage antirepressor YoqD-like protein
MYNWLRENNILMSNNKPYQRYMDREYFEVIEYSYKTKEGEHLVFKTLITPKGQMYLAKKLIDKQD